MAPWGSLRAEAPEVANGPVAKQQSAASLFPAEGQTKALYEGGPVMVNHGESLEYRYPGGGGMTAFYEKGGRLLRTQETDSQGVVTETREFGAETIVTHFEK